MSHTQMAVDFNPDPLNGDDYSPPSLYPQEPKGYALSGKIMLTAIIVLLFVVLLMIALHLYARWYLLHRRRRNLFLRRNRHNRRTHIVFYSPDNAATASRGLDSSVLKSLPLFTYFSAEHHQQPLECAVCLSEFDDGETARLLPKCKHSFHVNCIDMWFHSHSTCPLCRSPVEAPQPEADHNPEEAVVVSLVESDCPEAAAIGSSSGVCVVCEHEEQAREPGPSSIDGRRKPMEIVGVSIEVPRRSLAAEELACDSPASRHRSPMSRMLSFTRILGRERRGNLSPATPTELDVERGLGREDVHAQQ